MTDRSEDDVMVRATAPSLFGVPSPGRELLAWSWAEERLTAARE